MAQDAPRMQEDSAKHDLRSFGPKSLLKQKVANRTVDAVPIDPNVRVSESVEPAAAAGGQPAAMEANTDGEKRRQRQHDGWSD